MREKVEIRVQNVKIAGKRETQDEFIIQYRLEKGLRNASKEYFDFKAGNDSRSPSEILSHLVDVSTYGLGILEASKPPATENSVFEKINENFNAMKSYVSENTVKEDTTKKLINGPLSDTLTHIGQLAFLRRLEGHPISWENYTNAKYLIIMAYDEFLADRARQVLKDRSVAYEEKKMMGGLCFMVDDKMCFGMHIDKKTDSSFLMARVGLDQYENALAKDHCSVMNFTGRVMKGYVFITEEGIDSDKDLEGWIQMCLDFNPLAKSSKKKAKK